MQPQSAVLALCLFASIVPSIQPAAAQTVVNFDPSNPAVGPFPTDFLTVPDSNQKTGLRVNLPLPDCTAQPSDCAKVTALNELDGFHLQPRIRVNFSAPVDPATLKTGIFFVALDNLTNDEQGLGPAGQISAINQIIYDPATNTAYAKPDQFFDQHRHYALVVTDAVLTPAGNAITPDPNFTACIQNPTSDYCNQLQNLAGQLTAAAQPANIVALSVFTTMSATTWLEQARDLLPQIPANYQSLGDPVPAASITAIRVNGGSDGASAVPIIPGLITLNGIDRVVFGSFQSPAFLNDQQYIPNTPTGTPLTPPPTTNTIVVHAFIPSSPMPPNGYPVIIDGHALGENAYVSPTLLASTYAQAGFVTLAINAVGHGYGPQAVVNIVQSDNSIVTFPAGGRYVNADGLGKVADSEGCIVTWPYPANIRDCIRQTVVDLIQLVNVVSSGTPLDPSTNLQLDPANIYYSGISMGALIGTVFHAIDPRIQAAVPCAGGGSPTDIIRWTQKSPIRQVAKDQVLLHLPSLANLPGDFNDNYVLRDQPPLVNTVPGAIDIQNMFGDLEWLQASGDPLSYAVHLTQSPLPGMQPKPTLFQWALNDLTVPNSQTADLLRAAGTQANSTEYRTDLAPIAAQLLGETFPANYDPHEFLADVLTDHTTAFVAASMQQQITGFFSSVGATVPDPNAFLQALFPVPLTVTLFETTLGSAAPAPPPNMRITSIQSK